MIQVGEQVGDYRIERLLGHGGMAEVWLVRHAVLGSHYALKCLQAHSVATVARLLQEGRAQAQMRHPNLLPVHEILTVHGAPALLMPFVDGPALDVLLQQHTFTRPEALAVFKALLDGLSAAHRLGFVHRDLKPSNILLDQLPGRLQPRIADFGLVKVDDQDLTVTGAVFGTPAYAAPEQLRDASTADALSDLFSMGVIFAELLTGRRPFAGTSIVAVYEAHKAPPDLDGIAPPLQALIRALLSIVPEHRPSSAAAVSERLGAISGEPLATGGVLWAAVDSLRRSRSAAPARPDKLGMYSMLADRTTFHPTPHNLPAIRDRFIGRKAERKQIRSLLHRRRIVTLTGFGGVGKTRLALETVRLMLDEEWPGGIWFVSLADARTLDGVMAAVAAVVDVHLADAPAEQLAAAIRSRGPMLLVLDNFEQIVSLAEDTIGRWVEAAPKAVFLTTSREPLWLRGEHLFAVEPFEPADAVALFSDRASSSRRQRRADDAADVAALVELLDGLPLAIELAAARARMFSPVTLRTRLQARLDLLSSRSRDLPERQRTLRATLQWSWDLLRPYEQSAMAQLSVFEGGFTVEAAAAVLDLPEADAQGLWIEDILSELVDKSLLNSDGAGRLTMLVSIQRFAAERVAEPEAVQQRHGAWFAELGTPAALQELYRPTGLRRREVLAVELDNLIATAQNALARGDGQTAAQAALAAGQHLETSGPFAAQRTLYESVLALEGPWRPLLLARTANLVWLMGDRAGAEVYCREALAAGEKAGDRAAVCVALMTRVPLHLASGAPDAAAGASERCLALAEQVGDERLIFDALDTWVLRAMRRHNPKLAMEPSLRMLSIAQRIGDLFGEARALHEQGCLKMMVGELESARSLMERALTLSTRIGHHTGTASTTSMLARVAREQGDISTARERLAEALEMVVRDGQRHLEQSLRLEQAIIAYKNGDPVAGEASARQAAALAEVLGQPRRKGLSLLHVGAALEKQERGAEAEAAYRQAVAIARSLSLEPDTCAFLSALGQLQQTRDPADAEVVLQESLAIAEKLGFQEYITRNHCLLSRVLVDTGRGEEAASLLDAVAARLPADHPHQARIQTAREYVPAG